MKLYVSAAAAEGKARSVLIIALLFVLHPSIHPSSLSPVYSPTLFLHSHSPWPTLKEEEEGGGERAEKNQELKRRIHIMQEEQAFISVSSHWTSAGRSSPRA